MLKINEIAEKDANLYILKMGEIFKEIIYEMTDYSREIVWEYLDNLPPEEVFYRIFAGFNFASINNIWLHHFLFPEIKEQIFPGPGINLPFVIKLVFQKNYNYAAGEDIPEEYLRFYIKYIDIYLKFLPFLHLGFQGRPLRNSEDIMLQTISSSCAEITSLIKSRKNIEYNYIRYKNGFPGASVPIRVITDFAKISHQGVLKNIHSSNLAGEKVNNNWQIPVQDAVNFLKKRKNCPQWILNLP